MNTFLVCVLSLFLLILNMVESSNRVTYFDNEKLINLTDLRPQFDFNLTKSEKFAFAHDVLDFSNIFDAKENQSLKTSNTNLFVLLSFSVVGALSVLINIRVFHIVFITSRRRSRPANILVAHLTAVVIVFTLVFYIYVLEKTNVVSLTAPGICNVFAFLRNNIYNVFPLNAGAIIWARSRSDATILRKSFAYRFVGMMWAITVLGNLPSTIMVQFSKGLDNQKDKCKEIPLFGSFGATITYESLRFILFNVMVCIYLIRATIKIRSSMKYLLVLKLIRSERLKKRTQQVRWVYLHTFIFILNWFPNGLILFLYKIFSRLGWTTDYAKFLTPFVFLNFSAFILCPLSYVFLLEHISIRKLFLPCLRKNDTTNFVENVENYGQVNPEQFGWKVDPIVKPNLNTPPKPKAATTSNKAGNEEEDDLNIFEFIEMSLMTTVGFTGTSESVAVAATKVKYVQEPIFVQGSSIPAVLTPTTSAKLQSFAVQMHVEPEVAKGQITYNTQVKSNHGNETFIEICSQHNLLT